ncbi:uncharacterized protein [Spinacia oleracea]|uniref:Uncharacterized protein n=1 Tax=Spinacia oleracea TaxID=3562 RepID=A0ABM3QHQ8_SPIOL|nr:uncharacterized protein LOC130459505 [Spinacia oleracea]
MTALSLFFSFFCFSLYFSGIYTFFFIIFESEFVKRREKNYGKERETVKRREKVMENSQILVDFSTSISNSIDSSSSNLNSSADNPICEAVFEDLTSFVAGQVKASFALQYCTF